jgi:ornithine cyclodeaminase/alanine dehydrogenase-like protein (mu-crystallin family)
VPSNAPGAILLSKSETERLLDHRELLEELRRAMCLYSASGAPARRAYSVIPSSTPQSVMIVFPGLVPGIPAYTVKVNAKLPASVPSVCGLIALHDLDSGRVLAVMDSMAITAIRTALVGALAAQALARTSIETVGVIGAGVQGRAQLRALRLVRDYRHVRVYDSRPDRAAALVADLRGEIPADFSVAPTVAAAVANADVVITATWANAPFLSSDMIAPGTHITAVGADEPGKAELDAALIARSKFVCDDADLAVEMGALAGAGLGRHAIHATLGEILAGAAPARASDAEVTVFGSVGLPCQDLPAAWMVFQKAKALDHSAFAFHV